MFGIRLIGAFLLSLTAVSAGSGHSAQPLPAGKYCLKEPVVGYTGTGHGYQLGNFVMVLQVMKKGGDYAVRIKDQLPDNSQILDVRTNRASILRDGSLAFRFADAWDNQGKARVYPTGKVLLVMTKKAKANQIGRNYGTFIVYRSPCSSAALNVR